MSDNYRGDDEFSFMSEHRQYLKDREQQQILQEQQAKEQARLEKEARLKAQREQGQQQTPHPPYGKPYKTDRKIKQPPRTEQKSQSKPTAKKPLSEEEIKRRRQIQQQKEAQRRANEEKIRRQKIAEKRRQDELKRKKAEEKRRFKVANKEAAKSRRNALISSLLAYLVVIVIAGGVLFASSYLIFRLTFASNTANEVDGYTYTINGEKKYIKSDISFRNGTVYLCGDDIANMCNLTVAGDENEIKYISPGEGNETASFITGTRRAFINRTEIRLSAETFIENERFYIPLDFFQNYMYGIKVVHNSLERTVSVSKVITNETDVSVLGAPPKYADVTYKIKSSEVIQALDENALDESVGNFNYKIDIAPYAQYINPKSLFEYTGIINSSLPSDGEHLFTDLVNVPKKSDRVSGEIKLRECAAKALEAMFAEAEKDGISRIYVFRGYVSAEDLAEKAEDEEHISLYGPPEYDEHQLGLTVEIYYKYRDVSFDETESFAWLKENAHKFGFVLRYSENKEGITNVDCRPWTFRFVGRYNAVKMHDEGLCLEEYVEKYLTR